VQQRKQLSTIFLFIFTHHVLFSLPQY